MKLIKRESFGLILLACTLVGVTMAINLRAGEKCLPLLQAAEIARHDFSTKIKSSSFETEYDEFVGNIDNYSIGLNDAGDIFFVVFRLKGPGRGEIVKGGGAVYKIRKSDLSIVSFVGQE